MKQFFIYNIKKKVYFPGKSDLSFENPIFVNYESEDKGYVFDMNIVYTFILTVEMKNNTKSDYFQRSKMIGSLRQLPDQKMVITNK